jgi:hypothetical protein
MVCVGLTDLAVLVTCRRGRGGRRRGSWRWGRRWWRSDCGPARAHRPRRRGARGGRLRARTWSFRRSVRLRRGAAECVPRSLSNRVCRGLAWVGARKRECDCDAAVVLLRLRWRRSDALGAVLLFRRRLEQAARSSEKCKTSGMRSEPDGNEA